MEFILCEDYHDLSAKAAEIIADTIQKKPDAVLGLATGGTPVETYRNLVRRYEAGQLNFAGVTTYNLDEYYPIQPDNPQSYRYFMNEHLFSKVNVRMECTFVPQGDTADPQAECRRYEDAVTAAKVDLQLLGIGENGHIGFNEPEEALYVNTHLTALTESTKKANARFFASEDEVPHSALTMGMGTIMKAKKILLLISGANKHAALRQLRSDRIDSGCPATFLKLHPNVVVLYDKAADMQ